MQLQIAMPAPLINPIALDKILKRRNAARIIRLYLEDAVVSLTDLRAAVTDNDAHRLTQAAHKLKGSSSYVGASAVQELSAELEQLGRGAEISHPISTTTASTTLLTALEQEFERTQQVLQVEASRLSIPNSAPPDGGPPTLP
jgi:HPt (histidine-containing phosphotransfer) domain-containing protein